LPSAYTDSGEGSPASGGVTKAGTRVWPATQNRGGERGVWMNSCELTALIAALANILCECLPRKKIRVVIAGLFQLANTLGAKLSFQSSFLEDKAEWEEKDD